MEGTNAGAPDNNVISQASFSGVPTAGGDDEWVKANFASPVQLEAGTYALVFFSNDTGLQMKSDTSASAYAGGSVYNNQTEYGAGWAIESGSDMLFRIEGFTENPFILFPEDKTSKWTSKKIQSSQLITSDTTIGKVDFDLDIGTPMSIEGKAFSNLTWSIEVNGRSGEVSILKGNIKLTLKKVREGSETIIGTSESFKIQIKEGQTETTTTQTVDAISIECSRKNLTVGDKLRLTIEAVLETQDRNGAAPRDERNDNIEIDVFPTIDIPFNLEN